MNDFQAAIVTAGIVMMTINSFRICFTLYKIHDALAALPSTDGAK